MRARHIALVVAVLLLASLAGGAKRADANGGAAAWVGGKLLEGAGSGAASAVVGNLMAHAGLDPTQKELEAIAAQLAVLSQQMTDLQATSKQTLEAVLGARFESQFNQLHVTTVRDLQSDYLCWLSPAKSEKEQKKRESCRAHFETEAPKADLGAVVNHFNDLLAPAAGLSVVQTYAKLLVGSGRFYTRTDQHKVDQFATWLDSLQVAAATFYTEEKNLEAVGKDEAAAAKLHASAERGAELLAEHRADQQNRNPVASNPGVLDTRQRIWIRPQAQDKLTLWKAIPAKGSRWALPSTGQILDMVRDRGSKTVKAYLTAAAGLELANVAEFGETGELWTSTRGNSCGTQYILACYQTVSTNNAYVREHGASTSGGGPMFYSILVSGPTAEESARYSFIWTS